MFIVVIIGATVRGRIIICFSSIAPTAFGNYHFS